MKTDSRYTKTKKPNKQHDARAASFKRIARALRAQGKHWAFGVLNTRQLAKVFDDEAKLLGSMR